LELHTLSTWHSNQQVDGSHYEAEATIFIRDMCKKKYKPTALKVVCDPADTMSG
jgi:hypothetical protein